MATGLTVMRPMSDSVFLDTNVLVFGYSFTEIEKQGKARRLIAETNSHISTQVLQELANTLNRKFLFSFQDVEKAIIECRQNNITHVNTDSTLLQACKIADRYRFSFYDSLIISAALESDCSTLYTEDMSTDK